MASEQAETSSSLLKDMLWRDRFYENEFISSLFTDLENIIGEYYDTESTKNQALQSSVFPTKTNFTSSVAQHRPFTNTGPLGCDPSPQTLPTNLVVPTKAHAVSGSTLVYANHHCLHAFPCNNVCDNDNDVRCNENSSSFDTLKCHSDVCLQQKSTKNSEVACGQSKLFTTSALLVKSRSEFQGSSQQQALATKLPAMAACAPGWKSIYKKHTIPMIFNSRQDISVKQPITSAEVAVMSSPTTSTSTRTAVISACTVASTQATHMKLSQTSARIPVTSAYTPVTGTETLATSAQMLLVPGLPCTMKHPLITSPLTFLKLQHSTTTSLHHQVDTSTSSAEVPNTKDTDGNHESLWCEFCQKGFVSWAKLSDHRQTHKNDKQFQCRICSKVLHSFRNLEIHYCIHSTKKIFRCVLCCATFTHYVQMRKHVSVAHPAEKLHQCCGCMKRFSTQQQVNTHQKKWKCHL